MRARSFFYVSLGILALVLAYHLGASTAGAQATGNPIVFSAYEGGSPGWITANGDIYQSTNGSVRGPYVLTANVFSGGATPTAQKSWGQVKVEHR